MDYIVIEGVRPWDGRYELDPDRDWTRLEVRWIKQLTGYMPVSLSEGINGGDPDVTTVVAIIAMVRAGRVQPSEVPDVYRRFDDVPAGGGIRLEIGVDEATEQPDPLSPTSSNGNDDSSGASTTSNSAMWDTHPRQTGSPGLDTSESVPVTSAT